MTEKKPTAKEVLEHLYQQIKKARHNQIKTKKELNEEMQKLKKEVYDEMKKMGEDAVKTRKKLQDDMHDYVKQRYRWLERKIDGVKE